MSDPRRVFLRGKYQILVVLAYVGEYEAWKKDCSIPLAQVLDSFDIYYLMGRVSGCERF